MSRSRGKSNNGNRADSGGAKSKGGARPAKSRRRRKPKQQRHFWIGQDPMEPSDEIVTVAADPAAVVRSLGPPPLASHSAVAEHYFTAVYERAVSLASALAMAGDLLEDEAQ